MAQGSFSRLKDPPLLQIRRQLHSYTTVNGSSIKFPDYTCGDKSNHELVNEKTTHFGHDKIDKTVNNILNM